MKEDLLIQDGITIPATELEISASRSGGAGGQSVNKTSSRISVRWNVITTNVLSEHQKHQVMEKLQSELTTDGDIIVHHSSSRSQHQNKKMALEILANKIRTALHVPKKRMKSKAPKGVKEARLKHKKKRSEVKKLRRKKYDID